MFLYDQSSGHIKIRKDCLITSNVNVGYGGISPEMHNTDIFELVPYPAMLSIGNKHSMVFDELSKDPFWIDASCSKFKMNNSFGGKITKDKTKSQLYVELRMGGAETTQRI